MTKRKNLIAKEENVKTPLLNNNGRSPPCVYVVIREKEKKAIMR